MPSPFPGMNPYLEQADSWQDFHNSYLVELRARLHEKLRDFRPDYVVKVEEQVYIRERPEEDFADENPSRRHVGRADVSVAARAEEDPSVASGPSAATIVAPLRIAIEPEVDVRRLSRLTVVDLKDRELITVIELLSPVNKKRGDVNRLTYESKRKTLIYSPVNFVEIDLLRYGGRMQTSGLPACDYCVAVHRGQRRFEMEFWPIRLREPLPVIPVPLRDGEPDVPLDLMPPLHRVYDAAGYGNYIYRDRPLPPLRPDDAEWARSVIEQASPAR